MRDTLEDRKLQEEIRAKANYSMSLLETDLNQYHSLYSTAKFLESKLDDSFWFTAPMADFLKYPLPFLETRLDEASSNHERKEILQDAIEFYKSKLN